MSDYERELMANGIYTLSLRKTDAYISIPMPPKRPVSPYAKFDKYHHKKKKEMKVIRKSDGIVIDYIADHEIVESAAMVSLAQIRDCLSNRIAPYTDPNSVIASVEQVMNQLKEDLK